MAPGVGVRAGSASGHRGQHDDLVAVGQGSLEAPLSDGDQVTVLPAVAGG